MLRDFPYSDLYKLQLSTEQCFKRGQQKLKEYFHFVLKYSDKEKSSNVRMTFVLA